MASPAQPLPGSSPPRAAVAEPFPLSPRARRIGWAAATLIRLFSLTFRWRLHDPEGLARTPPERPMIWIAWHNRVFALPVVYRRYLRERNGAVLSSASRDGEIIAATVRRFGCGSVRGSSSRRGAAAVLALKDWLKTGRDVAIIPDGPRGPRYRMGPGAIKLASVTGALILPVRIDYGSAWAFRSWDRFRLPMPFTTVTVTLGPCLEIPPGLEGEAFENERLRIERALNPDHETD